MSIKLPLVSVETLRDHLAQAVAVAKAYELADVCVRLGIQGAVEPDDEQEAYGSKRLYVRRRIISWGEPNLSAFLWARRLNSTLSTRLHKSLAE
ncbi:hypothetical protein, partial [Burkholderia cenocepacia]